MIALETSSSVDPRALRLPGHGAHAVSGQVRVKGFDGSRNGGFRCAIGFISDGIACRRPRSHGTIRAIESTSLEESHGRSTADRREPELSRRGVLQGAGRDRVRDRQRRGAQAARSSPSTRRAGQNPATCRRRTCRPTQKELIISNWPAYIDPREEGRRRRSKVFQERTGITVDYTDDVNDNTEFFAKVSNQLGACEPINRDMIMLTDWMAARMIGLGLDPAARQGQGAEPPRQPDRAAAQPAVGPRPRVPRAVAERPDRHRLQRGRDRRGQELRGAAHPRRPQGPDHPALRDARHDGLHAQGRRRRPERLHRRRVEGRDRPAPARSSPTARSGRSPATSTSRTSPPATSSPARRGPAT